MLLGGNCLLSEMPVQTESVALVGPKSFNRGTKRSTPLEAVVNRFIALFPLLFAAAPSTAQEADWSYTATVYAWLPAITTELDTFRFGTVESELDIGDVLSALDMAFFGAVTAQRGRLGFAADLVHSDLSGSKTTPFNLFGEGTIDTQLTTLSGYVLYRVTSDPTVDVDLGVGFRYIDLEATAALTPGRLRGLSETAGDSWVDPLIAARLSVTLNDEWKLKGFADWGGAGSGTESWQVYAGAAYAINDRWSTEIGYRYMEISNDLKGRDVSLNVSGPLIGFTYNF